MLTSREEYRAALHQLADLLGKELMTQPEYERAKRLDEDVSDYEHIHFPELWSNPTRLNRRAMN